MSSQAFRLGGRPILLLKGALGAAVALAAISLNPEHAHAYVVSVNSIQYDVTTFTGTYNSNSGKFETPANGGEMPWRGSSSLAQQFAAAVGGGLAYPNGDNGPFFAWGQGGGNISIWYTYKGDSSYPASGFPYGQYSSNAIPVTANYVWAQATLYTAPAPGPLPLFGAGAAFGFSRRLRKRIQGSRLPIGSSQPLA